MNVFVVWPYFVMVAVCIGLISLRPFRRLDVPDSQDHRRFSSIDGLRGFLALSVFALHLVAMYRYLHTGVWEVPPSRFYTLVGQAGVAMFFMITGFLFWGKVLDERERMNWRALYIGRVFRIGPVYLVAIAIMLLWAFTLDGQVRTPVAQFLSDIASWMALGAAGIRPFNGSYSAAFLMLSVTWTLQYEWVFYAALPVMAAVIPRRWRGVFAPAALVAACIVAAAIGNQKAVFVEMFLCGMTSAFLVRRFTDGFARSGTVSLIGLASLAGMFVAYETAYRWECTLLLGIFFFSVAAGSTCGGLLVSRPAIRLGHISYSLYLLHGLVLNALLTPPFVRAFAMSSGAHYWEFGLLAAIVLVALSATSYIAIERRGIAIGKIVASVQPQIRLQPTKK